MCVVHYCGSKSILPIGNNINDEVLEKGLQFEDQSTSAHALKNLISARTNIPLDHLKLYNGKDLILLEDDADVDASNQLYFTILTCKDINHCPSQVKIVTLFGQFRAPFTKNTTVLQLKEYVKKAMQIPVEQQNYKFKDHILENREILTEKEVIDGSEIRLDPKTRGF